MSFPRFLQSPSVQDPTSAKAANSANSPESGTPKLATLAGLADLQSQNGPTAELPPKAEPRADRATWTRTVTPDSRHPLVPSEVRAKIEAIEPDARSKGWPAELLWNRGFWDSPRGLAALLDPNDEIAEVTHDHIAILKTRRDLLRFRRYAD